MKKFFNILNIILITYITFHIIYTIYIFTQSIGYGLIWLAISLIEIIILLYGKKHQFLKILLSLFLVIQTGLSVSIMVLGFDTKTNDADYVLVLGYQLDNNQMSETLEKRLDKAHKYLKNNPDSILVLCGGITRNNTISEAEVMYNYLLGKGVDKRNLILENKSTDTIENIENSLNYIDQNSKIVVISSNYHVFRAKKICERVNLEVKTVGSSAPLLLIPNQLLFEKIGFIKLFITQ